MWDLGLLYFIKYGTKNYSSLRGKERESERHIMKHSFGDHTCLNVRELLAYLGPISEF